MLYNTLTERPPQLVKGKRELAYTLEFPLKKKIGTSTSDADASWPNDIRPPGICGPPTSQIVLDDSSWDFLDFDHERPEPSSIRLLQEPPLPSIFKDVNVDLVNAFAPELSGTNLEFIQQGIASCRLELVKALVAVRVNEHAITRKPNSENVMMIATVQEKVDYLPTHVFAVIPTKLRAMTMRRAGKTPEPAFFPVHGVVFALNCIGLPPPPPMIVSEPKASYDGRKIALPVLPLSLPYPENFKQLICYLYTKELEPLLQNLLPPSHYAVHPILKQDTEGLMIYAKYLADTYPAETLVKHIIMVHGFWLNMCALRVLHGELWGVIRMVWAVLIQALSYSVGEPVVDAHFEGPEGRPYPFCTMRLNPEEPTVTEPWIDGCVIA